VSISAADEAPAREYYGKLQMPLFTWSSLAGGFFSGRLRRDNVSTFETYLDKLAVTVYANDDNFKRLDRVQQLADEKGLSIPQIATAYVMSYPLNIFALVGCQTSAEYKANVAASEVRLTAAEMAWLELKSDSR
jgi:aryl-alcohol dehydrogenase-like predicted oxidoreductase